MNENENPLEDQPFSYRKYKNGKVSISYEGKEITILRSKMAKKFLAQIEDANDMDAQMVMAKITGNFKHGNERAAKQKGRT